ncbi:MAG: biotin-dependent carboxyltransferase family protein [Candidatus Marinimicrobia bacterium]|nr:biotin-dependent carboxyltransferase family protein [Candidatus Neomarinimicrobiota bacterium]MBL7010387.1 biotin-dependent carboxyltransferase family protein [Candidatus Neomarinimicrobiota bacterium]MBL7030852.1 biotin-dependent carboxyltransferase family protein [Candidatus Neomarinimicrobiota bacterium]
MSITVLKAGLQTTVQDLGRNGYAHYGISASGAADAFSLRIGNLLVGNDESAAALELTILGGDFKFESHAFIALSGSEFEAHLDGESFQNNEGIYVRSGQILSVGQSKEGARTYLCVRGGVDVPYYLSGKTTHVMSKMGGLNGRQLEKGDSIKIGNLSSVTQPIHNKDTLDLNCAIIRVTNGLQGEWFSDSTWNYFLSNSFTISDLSSRMGIRLTGNLIQSDRGNEILTEGIPLGAIQVPGSGDPIISFVEHQTTGGYPKIANVITADLCKVGQLKPGDTFKFQRVSIEEGERLRLEQESFIQSLKAS